MPAKKTSASAGKPAKKTPARRTAAAPARRAEPMKKKSVAKKKSAVAQPRKITKNAAKESLWEDNDLTYQYPSFKKNNFLSLIVLGLGALLVLTGIYIQVHKNNAANSSVTHQTETTTGGSNVTGASTSGKVATLVVATTGTFPVDAQRLVETFFTYFNQDQFDKIGSLYDKNFQTVQNLITYFSPKRLESWKKNIIGDLQVDDINAVIDHPFVQKNSNAMVVQYQMHYILGSDGKQYDETWFAYVLKYGSVYKLDGFACQTNCAASPFFHLR